MVSAEPLLPYLQVPELVLLSPGDLGWGVPPSVVCFKPFGVLVASGVVLGVVLTLRQGRRLGFDHRALTSFIAHVVITAFVAGHVLHALTYEPQRVASDPLLLLRPWDGLSSLGGFFGALLGGVWWSWRTRSPLLPYGDVLASAFPTAWVFGRAGCSLAHDHPGVPSDLWFAVRFPGGGRLDLGLCELALTIPLAVAFLLLRRRPRPWGFYCSVMVIAYAPTRFALDFLRAREPGVDAWVVDPRYGGLTPAQWGCLALLGLSVPLFWRALARAGTREAVAAPRPPSR